VLGGVALGILDGHRRQLGQLDEYDLVALVEVGVLLVGHLDEPQAPAGAAQQGDGKPALQHGMSRGDVMQTPGGQGGLHLLAGHAYGTVPVQDEVEDGRHVHLVALGGPPFVAGRVGAAALGNLASGPHPHHHLRLVGLGHLAGGGVDDRQHLVEGRGGVDHQSGLGEVTKVAGFGLQQLVQPAGQQIALAP
jgi:hypothetical protein